MATDCAVHLTRALERAARGEIPYRHWLLDDVLPSAVSTALAALPLQPPPLGDTLGRRETHNAARIFVTPESRTRFAVCAELAAALQAPDTIARFERCCGVSLAGSYLRVEYCLDTGGFWLEPHTDIGAKLFTFLIYLSDHPDAANWGTDILDADHHLVMRAPASFNRGLIFVPANNTWHGFAPRPINGVRRSLIVNYVVPDWRSRHELAFPDVPIGA